MDEPNPRARCPHCRRTLTPYWPAEEDGAVFRSHTREPRGVGSCRGSQGLVRDEDWT